MCGIVDEVEDDSLSSLIAVHLPRTNLKSLPSLDHYERQPWLFLLWEQAATLGPEGPGVEIGIAVNRPVML